MLKQKTVTILFLMITAILFTGCGIQYIGNSINANMLKKEDAKEFIIKKSEVELITRVDIRTRLADVEIIAADDYYVAIDYTYWADAPEYQVEDGILIFDDSDALPNSYSINFSLNNTIKIYLPEEAMLDRILIKSSSGDVDISGFKVDKLDLSISYGNLSIQDASAAKTDVSLSSGTSKMSDFNTGEMKFSNSYGDAKFTNINIPKIALPDNAPYESIGIRMSSGDVTIKGLYSESLNVSNSYGDVTCDDITVEEFDASMSSGNLDLSKAALQTVSISNSYGNATLSLDGPQEDYSLDLKTSYGDIKVSGIKYEKRLNLDGKGTRHLKAKLSSGNITVNFAK